MHNTISKQTKAELLGALRDRYGRGHRGAAAGAKNEST